MDDARRTQVLSRLDEVELVRHRDGTHELRRTDDSPIECLDAAFAAIAQLPQL